MARYYFSRILLLCITLQLNGYYVFTKEIEVTTETAKIYSTENQTVTMKFDIKLSSNKVLERIEILAPSNVKSKIKVLVQIEFNNSKLVLKQISISYKGRVDLVYQNNRVIFTLFNIQSSDFEYSYKCKASLSFLKFDFAEVSLIKSAPPRIENTNFFPKYSLKCGVDDEFVCRAVGDPVPEVTWEREEDDGKMTQEASGLKSAVLKITNAKTSDVTRYVCTAKNAGGVVTKEMSLFVNYIRLLSNIKSKNITLKVGDSIDEICHVNGHPEPSIVWKDPNNKIIRSTKEFKFGNVNVTEFGTYKCIANNTVGNVVFTLKVIQSKTVTPIPETKGQRNTGTKTFTQFTYFSILFLSFLNIYDNSFNIVLTK